MDALVSDLKERIAKGQVVAVVGAGVSIGATNRHPVASWEGLLRNGVERCQGLGLVDTDWVTSRQADIDRGIKQNKLNLLLSVAELITDELYGPTGGEWRVWLRETVGSLRVERREVIEALRDLGVILATTNYDGLLEEVTGLPPVTWRDGARVQRVLQGDEPGVLHLHGFWREPESVVLGIRSYERVLGDKLAQTLQQALPTMRTFLFVGCGAGLSDPNFGALRGWMRDRFAGTEYRHYRLVRACEEAAVRAEHPAEERVFPLSYGERHENLASFLRDRLAPAAKPRTAARDPAAAIDPLPAKGLCVGRDAVVEELARALTAEEPRPVPVLGGPGIGKSTVCRAALHDPRVVKRYGGRRFFVRLDGAATAEDVAAAVVQTLGLPVGSGAAARALGALAEAPVALALDNLETPLQAPDPQPVEELLCRIAEVPGVALAAAIRGTTFPPGPAWLDPIEMRRLGAGDDREMFLEIAGRGLAADPRLDDLLRELDGWPLAIELAARAAQGQRSLELVWRRWERERTRMLARAGGDHRLLSLAVSVELSIEGLAPDGTARRLLALLALLPDGLRLGDLGALLPDGGEGAAAALLQAALAFEEAGRLRMLAPLREHVAKEHAADEGDLARLVEHCTSLALELGPKAGRPGGAEAIARLAAEAANIEVALRRGFAGADPGRAAAAAEAFGGFQYFSGLGTVGLLDAAAAAARDEGLAARCLLRAGDVSLQRSVHDEARARYEEALPLYRRVGSVLGEANCVQRLGDIALERSAHDEARARYEEALPLYARLPEPYSIGTSHRRLARIAASPEERREHVEAARRAWLGIGRDDLVRELDSEFGGGA